ncbi:Fc.00g052620.m01.CDS01 [Cosmosporella sp. VM-42]
MNSPFPKSSSSAGDGRIVAKVLPAGGTGLETITYQYPLKLISPSPSGHQPSVLVFLLSYGGGLVGGDTVDLSIHVQSKARLSVVTQGHTKIFKSASPDIVTKQTLQVQIDDKAGLCLLPDPVQPFEDSVYVQTQIFKVSSEASLCLLDWVTQGRTARGENWSLVKWTGRNEVWLHNPTALAKDRLLVRDTVVLSKEDSVALGRPLKDTMHKMGIFGTLILRGSMTESLGDFFLAEFAALPRLGARDFRSQETQEKEDAGISDFERWRLRRLEKEKREGVLWSAAQVRGCVIVKFGASTVEAGRDWIGSMLVKEGSISDHFGDQALMCVR